MSGLPRLRAELGGALLEEADVLALAEVRVEQRLSRPAACLLLFRDPQGPLARAATLATGSPLLLTLRGEDVPLFEGEVSGLEYGWGPSRERTVRLRAHDRMHRLRLRQSLRAHVQVTAGDLARELVADLGLSVEAPEPGPLRRRIVQHRQTDLELLTEVAGDAGLFWTLRGNVLHLLTLEGTGDPLPLALGQSLLQARVAVSAEGVCRSVETAAWDPWRAEPRRGRAAEARVGRSASAEASPEGFSSPGERFLAGEVAQTDAEADALARADLDVRGAREVTLTAVAEGDPRLRPGALVEASGLAGPFTGRFVLCAVDHVLSGDTGFVSELSSAPPALPRRPDAAVAALGVVTRVDDPEELGRVRVSLPAFGDVETDWLEVVVPGAGRGKGIVALPDAEDRVLVLLARGDPAQGVVLGGLYGPLSPPDHGVEGAAVKRYTIRTPGGHTIQMDDGQATLRIEDSRGSRLEMAPDRLRLHAETDLEIEAPGHSVVVRAQRIDFERG